jgi:putative transposase
MLRSYKFRLYPSKDQAILLDKHIGCCRWVYNWALGFRIKAWQAEKKKIGSFELIKMLPALKKQEETAWLKEVSSASLQAVLPDLEKAYANFFAGAGFPKFKSKHRSKLSFHYPSAIKIDFEARYVVLPKFDKPIKTRGLTKFDGVARSSTISKSASGKYFCAVLVDDQKPLPAKAEVTEQGTLGLDLGLTHFAILSDGTKIENPRKLKWSLKKLAKLQRRHARKQKGSKNRNKARIKVARCHERVRNQRLDFLHKLSTKLIRENQAVAVEDLAVKNMVRNHCLARSISDASWGEFVRQLKYKAEWQGKTVLQIGRFEPSSKLCTCGVINRKLTLADRQWTCSSCGTTHDRDILAANNIKRMGLHQIDSNLVPPVRRELTLAESAC